MERRARFKYFISITTHLCVIFGKLPFQLYGILFTLLQNKDDARHLMTYYNPELGVELPERSYADACEITWDNMKVNNGSMTYL